jgi:alpha-1,2-mannosyltransferase
MHSALNPEGVQVGQVSARTLSFRHYFAGLLLLVACAEFVARGPARAITAGAGFNDFLSPYIQAQAWLSGTDPYNPQTLLVFWPKQAAQFEFLCPEVADGSIVEKRGIPTAYSPAALMLLAPFTLLPWPAANSLWAAINAGLSFTMILALASLAGLGARDWRTWFFIAFGLALAPFHTGIATGNPAIASAALGVIAVWLAADRRKVPAAVLMTVSVILKPQLGLCFLTYWLFMRRWQLSGIVLGVVAAASGLAVFRLEWWHVPWWTSYVHDNHTLLVSGILSDFTARNPTRFGLVNLQVPIYALTAGKASANYIAYFVFAALGAIWVYLFLSRGWILRPSLLPLGAMAMLALLPIYHRFYDAVLLAVPLAWGFSRAAKGNIRYLVLLLISPFLLPGGTLLEDLRNRGALPDALANARWWNAIVMPHQAWILLALAVVLVYAMAQRFPEDPPH